MLCHRRLQTEYPDFPHSTLLISEDFLKNRERLIVL